MEQEEMKVKNKWMLAVFLILTMVTCLMITACGGPDPVPEEDLIELTLEELAQFDGKAIAPTVEVIYTYPGKFLSGENGISKYGALLKKYGG